MNSAPDDLQGMIETKWTGRAESYSTYVLDELNCFKRDAWRKEIQNQAPFSGASLDVLDIGTGPGFFAILMAQMGWNVSAVDCTPEMIRHAEANARGCGVAASFQVMDSHALTFPDNAFDLLVSRNLTWTLRKPEEAYREWRRVLRPGGHLLIFDGNWYRHLFDGHARALKAKAEKEARERFGLEPFEEPDPELARAMYSSLPMGRNQRPEWDAALLPRLGYEDVTVDSDITGRVWDEMERVQYQDSPLFMIRARKAE